MSAPPVTDRDAAVYVHFPYCAARCPYCDFNAHAIPHDDDVYADAVIAELDARGASLHAPRGLKSIFFGGGTPSRWAPAAVGRVIDALRARYGFTEDIEITLEANPGTVVPDRFEAYVAAGVGRFSIGVQSLDDGELVSIGRIHDASAAVRAVRTARGSGARVSLDLMYGFPGQTWTKVRSTLDRALALGTEHVSAYALTIEPDTVLGRKTALGQYVPMPDDAQAELMERVGRFLEAAGLHRYEVSNYARPGAESRHNTLYWVGGAYLGLGAGAHSYLPAPGLTAAVRRENRRAPEAYLRSAAAGTFEATFEERLGPDQILVDRMLTALRVRWGLALDELDAAFSSKGALQARLRPELERMVEDGLVRLEAGRYRPTDRGYLFNDTLARRLVGHLDTDDADSQLRGVGEV